MTRHDQGEVFDTLGDSWWDDAGPLSDLDPLLGTARISFVDRVLVRPSERPALVLDFGAGGGNMTARLAGPRTHMMALDSSLRSIQTARRNISGTNVDFLVGVGERLPFADIFDVVLCMDVLEHVAEPAAVVAQASYGPGESSCSQDPAGASSPSCCW